MATWTNKHKTFPTTYGVAKYGLSIYGQGNTSAGIITNKDKN